MTLNGEIYDFCKSQTKQHGILGGCFDPDGQAMYLNMQGGRFLTEA